MDREHWKVVRATFDALVDLDAAGRMRALDERALPPDLRREVEALLASDEAAAAPRVIDRYEIVRSLGGGGMGAVYLARQSEPITREVALKLIRDGRGSADLLQRFQLERQALASLNHPHIARVFDAGSTTDGRPYFVMEYVPGVPITAYCRDRKLDRRERIELMIKVCDAVQHAHANGIVHRDLKPTNVLVTEQDGAPTPKVIDFGIAKAADAVDEADTPRTITGQLLGTPAYMSPEQARGRTIDARADLWAIGCLLFEIEAGRPAFPHENLGDTLVAVLSTEPDFDLLPADTPPALRRLVRRCLVKDPDLRLASAADARLDLLDARDDTAVRATHAARSRTRFALGALVAVLAVAGAWAFDRPAAAPSTSAHARKLRFHARGVSRVERHAPVISPDGARFAYVREGRLWVRRLDALEGAPLAGTEEAEYPFWSPDAQTIGYFARGSLWRVPADGGESARILGLRGGVIGGAGAVWTVDGEILYSRGDTDLYAVPARGGARTTRWAPGNDEHVHGPALLADGRGVCLVVHRALGPDTIAFVEGTRATRVHVRAGQRIGRLAWAPSGHLLFERRPLTPGLWAASFAPDTRTCGEPFLVAAGGGQPSVSRTGTLLYVPARFVDEMRLGWVGKDGRWLAFAGRPDQRIRYPSLSPDGRRAAATHRSPNSDDVWVQDLADDSRLRLNFEAGWDSWWPRWSPDGRWIIGHRTPSSGPVGPNWRLWMRRADGTGAARDLGPGSFATFSRDGASLLYMFEDHLHVAPRDAPAERSPFATSVGQREPEPSPDGRFVAYTSNENGIWEVMLTRYPAGDGKWQVSRGGATKPRWSPDGKRLYFVQANALYEAAVATDPDVRLGMPRKLIDGEALDLALEDGYDVDPDGSRFLVIRELRPAGAADTAVLIDDWTPPLEND